MHARSHERTYSLSGPFFALDDLPRHGYIYLGLPRLFLCFDLRGVFFISIYQSALQP